VNVDRVAIVMIMIRVQVDIQAMAAKTLVILQWKNGKMKNVESVSLA
jgi:hypothetical protein